MGIFGYFRYIHSVGSVLSFLKNSLLGIVFFCACNVRAQSCTAYFYEETPIWVQVLYSGQAAKEVLLEQTKSTSVAVIEPSKESTLMYFLGLPSEVFGLKKINGVLAVIKMDSFNPSQFLEQNLTSLKPNRFRAASLSIFKELEAIRSLKLPKKQTYDLVLEQLLLLFDIENIHGISDKEILVFMESYFDNNMPVDQLIDLYILGGAHTS